MNTYSIVHWITSVTIKYIIVLDYCYYCIRLLLKDIVHVYVCVCMCACVHVCVRAFALQSAD